MNSQTAVERALRLINPTPARIEMEVWRSTLNVLVDPARTEFADQTHSSGDRELRELLRKTFGPLTTNAEGYADLSTLIAASEPLLVKHFNSAEIKLAGIGRRLTLVPDESAVKLDRMPGFPFGTLVGNQLLVWNGGAPFVGDVTMRAPFVPALASIVGQLEEPYVLVLHSMGGKQIPSPARTQAKEAKAVAAEGK